MSRAGRSLARLFLCGQPCPIFVQAAESLTCLCAAARSGIAGRAAEDSFHL